MLFARLKDGIATEIPNVDTVWDDNNYCTPKALIFDGKGNEFGVIPLNKVMEPNTNPLTQRAYRDGCELIDGKWYQKWTVEDLPQEQVAENIINEKARVITTFTEALTNHLDAVAQTRRYDNRITCMVRAGFPGPFQAEAIAFATWCDTCNITAYQLLAEVEAGIRQMPETPQALIDAMPPMVWP